MSVSAEAPTVKRSSRELALVRQFGIQVIVCENQGCPRRAADFARPLQSEKSRRESLHALGGKPALRKCNSAAIESEVWVDIAAFGSARLINPLVTRSPGIRVRR